eukprot:56284-Chlamydomonas_euryale.AAC.1
MADPAWFMPDAPVRAGDAGTPTSSGAAASAEPFANDTRAHFALATLDAGAGTLTDGRGGTPPPSCLRVRSSNRADLPLDERFCATHTNQITNQITNRSCRPA